ncbi:hypothetical protein MTO96_028876 [Rhipicephalus appendiculatus]
MDDDDDLLHDILEFERIERERRELFGSRNPKPHVTIIFGAQPARYYDKRRDRRLEPWDGSTPAIAVHQPTQ